MTNDQLTALSAKAIGLRLLDNVTTDNGSRMIHQDDGGGFWHPLQSGNDIVRLIVAAGMNVEQGCVYSNFHTGFKSSVIYWQPHQGHAAAMAALRLAVTTLAARIGMEMEND